MGRALLPAEIPVLDEISAEVQQITALGTRQRLTDTGVLGADPQDYVVFEQRFARLHQRLLELTANGQVVVEPSLAKNMGANAAVTYADDGSESVQIQLRPSFLRVDSASSPTDRAITLIHEVSHCLYEQQLLPVKDYTYRGSWAHRYLTGVPAAENADTYADAAARVAGVRDGVSKRYAETGRLAYQRTYLAQHPVNVGAALAWADIKINRAWLRAEDYRSFARYTIGAFNWDAKVQSWEAQQTLQSRLWALEGRLRQLGGMIGAREGVFTVGLDKQYFATADAIAGYMGGLKDVLGELDLRLTSAGDTATYDPGAQELRVPYAVADTPPIGLGELIITALVDATPFEDATDVSFQQLQEHRQRLPNHLADCDRPQEKERVDSIKNALGMIPPVDPAQADWTTAGVELDLAALDGIADAWTRNVAIVRSWQGPPSNATGLDSLEKLVDPPADTTARVVRIAQRLGQASAARRQAAVGRLMADIASIQAVAVQRFPAADASYQQVRADLTPYA